MAEHSLTRRMLYDLVWSKPMTKAAEQLGLSDVGLKKICARYRVPSPGRGYWAKKDAGKPVKQLRLHETADPQEERIVIRGSEDRLPDAVREIISRERARRQPKPPPKIEQTDNAPVSEPHEAVLNTARILRSAKPDNGAVRAKGQGTCGIEVGVASIKRVVEILDGIAQGLEARGLVLAPAGTGIVLTQAIIMGTEMGSPLLRGKPFNNINGFIKSIGGEGGIRTPDTLAGTPVFETGAINRSATSP